MGGPFASSRSGHSPRVRPARMRRAHRAPWAGPRHAARAGARRGASTLLLPEGMPLSREAEASDVWGQRLLLLVFVTLYAGSFSSGRLVPGLPDVDVRSISIPVIVLAYIWWLGRRYESTHRPPLLGFVATFVATMTCLAISASWSPAGADVVGGLTDLAAMVVLTLVFCDLAGRLGRGVTDRLWGWLVVAAIVAFASSLVAGPDVQGRYAALGGGPNIYVRQMALGALAALYIGTRTERARSLLLLPVFGVGALMSGSRGGVAAIGVAAVVGVVPVLRRLGRTMRRRLLVAVGAAGAVIASVAGPAVVRFVDDRFIQQTLLDRYDSSRTLIDEAAASLIDREPVFGVGLGGFRALHPEWAHAHSIWSAARAEGGIVVQVLLVVLVVTVAVGVWNARPISDSALFALLAGTVILVASMFSGDWYDTRFAWVFFGLALIEARRSRVGAVAETTDVPADRRRDGAADQRRPPEVVAAGAGGSATRAVRGRRRGHAR